MVKKEFGVYTITITGKDTDRSYVIETSESGDIVEDDLTLEEAEALVHEYEKEDGEANGFYTIRRKEG